MGTEQKFGEISELGFDALASLLRMRGSGMEAARRVMVEGKTANEVSREMGMAYANVFASVKRARQGILQAKVVLDALEVPLGKIDAEAQVRPGQRGRPPGKKNSGQRSDAGVSNPTRGRKSKQLELENV